jgi:hypothetical protein
VDAGNEGRHDELNLGGSGQGTDGPQFTTDRIEKNPSDKVGVFDRTELRQMRGTKADDTGSEMRGVNVLLEGRRSEAPTHPRYCWIIIKTKDLKIEQFVID